MDQKAMLGALQERLGYSDQEMEQFLAVPRNQEVLARSPELMRKTLKAQVVQSHGCNSGHREGDCFYFDGAGNLLTKKGPSRICVFALQAITPLIFAATELVYAGADPSRLRFNRTSCFDVGLACGGWGQIILELQVEERKG